jgi:uncharacterized protein YhjY with autotransporter beta-barrel domain
MALSRPPLEHDLERGLDLGFRVKCAAATQCSMRAQNPNQSKRFNQSDFNENNFSLSIDGPVNLIHDGQCICHG